MGQFLSELRNPLDIFAANLPILKLQAWMGVLPVRVSGPPGNRQIDSPRGCFVTTLLHLLVFTSCYVYTILHDRSIVRLFFPNDISVLGEKLQLLTQLATTFMALVIGVFRREKFFTVLQKLAEVDRFATEIGARLNYKSTLSFIWRSLALEFILNVFFILLTVAIFVHEQTWPSFDILCTFFVPIWTVSCLVVLFVCIMGQIRHRFYLLNVILAYHAHGREAACNENEPNSRFRWNRRSRDLLPVQKVSFGIQSAISKSHYSMMSLEHILQAGTRMHHELCDICDAAETFFTQKMLTIVAVGFVIIIFDLFYILELLFTPTAMVKISVYEFVGFFLYQIIFYSMAIYCIVSMAANCVKMSEEVGVWVYKMLHTNISEQARMMVIQFALQVAHRKIKFTACGLFSLDRSLFFTIVGTLTTYLIILIQFSIANNSGSKEEVASKQNLSSESAMDLQEISASLKILVQNLTFGCA